MNRQSIKKIIFLVLIFAFIFHNPINKTFAETKLNWENPNKKGYNDPYKFQFTDVVNSQVMMQVVGCTGIVNKVSNAVMALFQTDAYKEKLAELKEKVLEKQCAALQKAAATGLSSVPQVDLNDPTLKEQCETLKIEDKAVRRDARKALEKQNQDSFREECLNGIAITLAKNQLTAMTRSTMNWVATGFGGDPMYVRNINAFIGSLTDQIISKELAIFQDPNNASIYPYGRDFSRAYYNSYNSSKNIGQALKQDLTRSLTGGSTIEDFSYDFARGGWAGWLGLTQNPQNNPIGSSIMISQHISQQIEREEKNTREELIQGGGLFNQKKCVEYREGSWTGQTTERTEIVDGQPVTRVYNLDGSIAQKEVVDPTDPKNCVRWENITPGSVIKDKISTHINSPERQLELADTINKGLNALFSALLDKFRESGLTGIGSNLGTDFSNSSGGLGSNRRVIDTTGRNTNINIGVDSVGYNRPFNITKDLGNSFIREDFKKLGTWNAQTNSPKLLIGVGEKNTYYEVTVAGKTKLMIDGYNNWEDGDRAFFDGEKWQNWKKNQNYPLEKRGVIQIQQDYIVATRELLMNLPAVMPKLGELDYCIPGPNPNWQANSSMTYSYFADYVSQLRTEYEMGSFAVRDYVTIEKAHPSSLEYRNYRNIFNGTNLWQKVTETVSWKNINSLVSNEGTKNGKWKGNSDMSRATEKVNDLIQNIFLDLEKFNTEYQKFIDESYGKRSSMLKQFLETESSPILLENSSYLPMAEEGLNLTKDILLYDSTINEETEFAKNTIAEANSNIYQLEQIKNKVNAIINRAQEDRDKNRDVILREIIDHYKLKGSETEKLAKANSIYNMCSEQEEIFYLTADDLIGIGSEKDRCSDGLDNDLNGYIDMNDANCRTDGQNIDTGIFGSGGTWNSGSVGIGTGTEIQHYDSFGNNELKRLLENEVAE